MLALELCRLWFSSCVFLMHFECRVQFGKTKLTIWLGSASPNVLYSAPPRSVFAPKYIWKKYLCLGQWHLRSCFNGRQIPRHSWSFPGWVVYCFSLAEDCINYKVACGHLSSTGKNDYINSRASLGRDWSCLWFNSDTNTWSITRKDEYGR